MSQDRVETEFVIFPAGPADAEALGHVHVATWRQTYRGLLPDAYLARLSPELHARRFARRLLQPGPNEVTLAAAARAGIVGYAEAGPSRRGVADEAEVATLYVLRGAQGAGLGRRLMLGAAHALAAEGARSLVVSVLAGNAPARRFYEHLGGEPEPPRRERGPGGAVVSEIAYRWAEIAQLTGG